MNILENLQILSKQKLDVDISDIPLETHFTDLGVDSLELIEFLFILENEFQIDLPDDRQSMQTIGGLVSTIETVMSNNVSRED